MRSGVPLHQLRKEVMIEAGLSTKAGHAVFTEERLNQLLSRNERNMATEDEWPGLNFEEEVVVLANAQTASLPTNITFTEISAAFVKFGTDWLPIQHGIGAAERSLYDDTQRATPIRRWEVEAPGTSTFEVWPIGNADQTILFEGSRILGGFEDDNDTCTLDADVLVLRVAAEILGRDRKEDAAYKLDKARELTNAITKKQGSAKRESVSMVGRRGKRLRPGIDYIPPGSGM